MKKGKNQEIVLKNNNNREIGIKEEGIAIDYLKSKGYNIVEKNFYTKLGEIDIIAYDEDKTLCFIEVKYRKNENYGLGVHSVDKSKQKRIYNTARYYMYKNYVKDDTPCRFDVISILKDEITLIKNAFP